MEQLSLLELFARRRPERRKKIPSQRSTAALERLAAAYLRPLRKLRWLCPRRVAVIFNARLRSTLGRADFAAATVELNPHLLDRNPRRVDSDARARALSPGGGSARRPRSQVEGDDGGLRRTADGLPSPRYFASSPDGGASGSGVAGSCGEGYVAPPSRRAPLPLRRLWRAISGHRRARTAGK